MNSAWTLIAKESVVGREHWLWLARDLCIIVRTDFSSFWISSGVAFEYCQTRCWS